jgi:lipopolysaccharide transport system ATP-binding protein
MSEVSVCLHGISKCYQIYERPQDRLKQSVMPRLQRWIGLKPKQYYKDFWALQNVSFEIKKGETVGIIGRNGSGKSTLLQILCGTLTPTSGEVSVIGRVGALLELGSGFNPEFTGRENVYMSGAILGLSRGQVERRFDDIVAFADIGNFIEQPVKTYSSGMYVRLAFSVIAHIDADILVIDEALSVGDVFFGQKCMRFLRNFMQHGTVIFVSHDTAAVLNLCDRVIWLRDGEIAGEGPSKEVTALYLEDLYYEDHTAISSVAETALLEEPIVDVSPRDMRQDLVNASQYRNDIEIFDFAKNCRAFGVGHASVVDAGFFDVDSNPLSWMIGGEKVRLTIKCHALANISMPIVGFEVYDRLGQTIFGDNTYLVTRFRPVSLSPGDFLMTHFDFRMPIMREGDYTISVAIAEGTQQDHVQHHWLHEALAFHVHANTICIGLVGVAMQNIEMNVLVNSETVPGLSD